MKTLLRISKAVVPAALIIAAPLAAFAQTNPPTVDTPVVSTGAAATTNVVVSTPVVSTSGSATVDASTTMKMHGTKGTGASLTNAISRANEEIDRRITNLNSLATRISAMKNVTAAEKTTLQASITAEVGNLTSLKATIDAETVLANLKTDVQSITKDYRIYMLVIPQGRVIAAADRIETIVADMQALAPKLQTRISDAQTAGKDVTAATSAYTDMQAKVSDANVQASAAASEVANLTPDQGNATTEASNTAALKAAAAKIKAATADLKAARADVTTILKAVKGTGSVTASSSANASTNVQ